ncbi:MAG: helix-hairpin-helix domain-containing protein [Chitinophagaceae bacterium]|nr:helix-hairpin-helix domain-containing protein [Chitinophagaceae bacterium]
MKRFISSYFKLSRSERVGMIAILILTLCLFTASICMRWLVRPLPDKEEQRLNLAWQQLQQAVETENGKTAQATTLFAFDPNTLDSAGFAHLGLSTRTTKYLLNWRRKGKHFYRKDDLKALYTLSAAEYERLAPYIYIATAQQEQHWSGNTSPAPLPDGMDLNTIDSATLLRLDGIGTVLAQRIVQRRRVLGSFLQTSQLLEVYKFSDSVFNYLQTKLRVYPETVTKIRLNTVTEEQLGIHPYIGPVMAKNIVLLRSGLNKYEKIEQLRQVPLMNEEKYRKIAPYCTID